MAGAESLADYTMGIIWNQQLQAENPIEYLLVLREKLDQAIAEAQQNLERELD